MKATGKTTASIWRKARAAFLAVALALGCTALPAGCSTVGGAAAREDVAAIADRVWAFGQAHPGGFTVDVRTLSEPAEGIAVAHAATQNSHSRGDLDRVVEHALLHDGHVGGWRNPDNGLYYFDSTRLFPEDRLEDALRFGRENGQHTVYILSTGREVAVDAEPSD